MGDSFTEGIGDPEPASPGGYRGWADRVAEELGRGPGRLRLRQPGRPRAAAAADRRPAAGALPGPQAGPGHAFRRRQRPDPPRRRPGRPGRKAGLGGPDPGDGRRHRGAVQRPGHGSSVLGRIRSKVAIYNENLRTIAARHDAVIADMWSLRQLNDPQMWNEDRLHFSPLGHHTIAAMVLDALNVQHSLEPLAPKPLPPRSWRGGPERRPGLGPGVLCARGWSGGCVTAPPATASRPNGRRRDPCLVRAFRWVRAKAHRAWVIPSGNSRLRVRQPAMPG